MMDATTNLGRRSYLRFSLRALLVVVVCIASYLAGHRNGFNAGYNKAADEYGDDAPLGSYDVSDLVTPLTD